MEKGPVFVLMQAENSTREYAQHCKLSFLINGIDVINPFNFNFVLIPLVYDQYKYNLAILQVAASSALQWEIA